MQKKAEGLIIMTQITHRFFNFVRDAENMEEAVRYLSRNELFDMLSSSKRDFDLFEIGDLPKLEVFLSTVPSDISVLFVTEMIRSESLNEILGGSNFIYTLTRNQRKVIQKPESFFFQTIPLLNQYLKKTGEGIHVLSYRADGTLHLHIPAEARKEVPKPIYGSISERFHMTFKASERLLISVLSNDFPELKNEKSVLSAMEDAIYAFLQSDPQFRLKCPTGSYEVKIIRP